MTKTTVTVPCDICRGARSLNTPHGMVSCPSCLGQGHVEQDVAPLTPDEAFIYVCAVRYAINRQTYAGGIVIQELQKVIPRIPYSDRKLLEKDIADALFKGEVDPAHKAAWEGLVADIQRVEGA